MHTFRLAAGTSSIAVAGILGCTVLVPAASAASEPTDPAPRIVDRETVQVQADSSGDIDHVRLFNQLTVYGNGTYTVADPTATDGLRNLDGFGKPEVRNGQVVWSVTTDGRAERRTVANVDADRLPVTLEASYTLDGKAISPGDLVGKSGTVQATYHVVNRTSKPTEITYTDGYGKKITESVDLVAPFVGQLMTELPKAFTLVHSPRGDLAGNGRGGTQVAFTLVLWEPIGSADQTFGWTANVTNATLPPATLQVLPVSPDRHPELKTGSDGYQAGAKSGTDLTEGSAEIDANLLKLRDGAEELLAGLSQLADGASRLSAGLNGEAAPGATKLAKGLADLNSGATQLRDGVGAKLSDSAKLAAGGAALADGAGDLRAGLEQISSGLGALANASTGLPGALAGAQTLRAGVDALLAGIGSASAPSSILGGLAQVAGGLDQLTGGAGLPAAKGGVDQVRAGLASAQSDAGTALTSIGNGVAGAKALVTSAKADLDPVGDATAIGKLDSAIAALTAVASGVDDLGTQLATKVAAADTGLGQVSGGLATAITGANTLSSGVAAITAGVTQVKLGLKSGSAVSPGLAEGLDRLVTGLTTAVGGIGQLNTGVAGTALPGATALAAGASQVADGTAQSAAGLTDLHTHLGELAAGTGEAAPGASDLAAGLVGAADGSTQLADGLAEAKGGGKQIADGTGQLREEGTSKLVESGNDAASEYGREYAIMKALNARGNTDALLYGAPEGGTGTSAYLYTLAAADRSTEQAAQRGALAVALALGAAFTSGVVLRRRGLRT